MKNLQTMKHGVQKGFTLIELMIVVAIIGILAALAIPAYSDYTTKARVAEAGTLTGAVKTGIEIYWSEEGALPSTMASVPTVSGSTFKSKYVTNVSIQANGVISVVLQNIPALGTGTHEVIYTPNTTNTNIRWNVTGTNVATKFRPKP